MAPCSTDEVYVVLEYFIGLGKERERSERKRERKTECVSAFVFDWVPCCCACLTAILLLCLQEIKHFKQMCGAEAGAGQIKETGE